MIFFQDSRISDIHVNWVGNKFREEGFSINEVPLLFNNNYSTDELQHLEQLLLTLISKKISKTDLIHQFSPINENLGFNSSYDIVYKYFHHLISAKTMAEYFTALMYSCMNHPKLESGIFLMVHLEEVQFEGEYRDAIGIFKLSSMIEGLQCAHNSERYDIRPSGKIFSIENLDLGAIILNTDSENGYKVLIHCSGSVNDLIMFKDYFLKLRVFNNDYIKTSNFMNVFKNFVTEKLDDSLEVENMDKVDLLNRAINHVSDNETLIIDEFTINVIGNHEVSNVFNNYLKNFQEEMEMELPDQFTLSSTAVKKAKASYKQVIKLDKNFHLYVHGKRDLVEKGFDESKGMNFYKVYFENEY